LALDVPSGFDARNGTIHDPVIHADATLTLALPKAFLAAKRHEHVAGALYLADISVPPALYTLLSKPLEVAPFAHSDVLRLLRPEEDI
jgi:NAD(P)H-hydrate epimerase